MNSIELKQLADTKFNFAVAKLNLKERVNEQLTVAHAGGLFKSTQTLITFLTLYQPDIIEDTYGNPIKIDPKQLLKELLEAYAYANNAWHEEYQKLRKVRKGNDLTK